MKRKALIRQLAEAGCVFVRHGAKHDIHENPKIGKKQPVPRHTEIDDKLAKHRQKYLGL